MPFPAECVFVLLGRAEERRAGEHPKLLCSAGVLFRKEDPQAMESTSCWSESFLHHQL